MSGDLRTLALALSFGLLHALDADHVVAVSTLVARTVRLAQALSVGALWGVGHTATVAAVGSVIIVVGVRLPAAATPIVELAVAVTLVGLGVRGLRRALAPPASGAADEPGGTGGTATGAKWRALWVGAIHGCAGSAGLVLLALTTVDGRASAAAFLAVFEAGTVAGMVVLAGIVWRTLAWGDGRSRAVGRLLRRGVAAFSVGVGVALAVAAIDQVARAG